VWLVNASPRAMFMLNSTTPTSQSWGARLARFQKAKRMSDGRVPQLRRAHTNSGSGSGSDKTNAA